MFVRVVTFVGWYGCDKAPSDGNSTVVALLREANFRVVGSLVAVFLPGHSCFAIRCGECSFDLLLQYAARSAAACRKLWRIHRIVAWSYRAKCLLVGPLVVTHNASQSKKKQWKLMMKHKPQQK